MESLMQELDNFTGTEQYHRHYLGIRYTDGVKYLAEQTQAFWLIDVIASYQGAFNKSAPFQIWTITVTDNKAVVTMKEDTNRTPLITQDVPHTNFPLASYELYCIDGIILLKSEY